MELQSEEDPTSIPFLVMHRIMVIKYFWCINSEEIAALVTLFWIGFSFVFYLFFSFLK